MEKECGSLVQSQAKESIFLCKITAKNLSLKPTPTFNIPFTNYSILVIAKKQTLADTSHPQKIIQIGKIGAKLHTSLRAKRLNSFRRRKSLRHGPHNPFPFNSIHKRVIRRIERTNKKC